MHPQIRRRLDTIRESGELTGRKSDTTESIQRNYLKATEGNSRDAAIRAFCYECMGYDAGYRESIKNCTDVGCPLYPYRPHKATEQPLMPQNETLESTIS